MSQDALPTAANETGDGIGTRAVRRKTCIYTLLLGAMLGVMLGILNVAAMNNHWAIQNDFFDVVDAPVRPFMRPRFVQRLVVQRVITSKGPFPGSPTVFWTTGNPNAYSFRLVLVMICYWTFIGLFVGSLFWLFRTGADRDIVRDRVCRWLLFLGACAGFCIGSLSFLAASNEWNVLSNFFNSFNRPVNSVMDTLQNRYRILDYQPRGPQTEFISRNTAVVIYWTLICFFVTSIYCVVRILGKRKAAGENPLPEE